MICYIIRHLFIKPVLDKKLVVSDKWFPLIREEAASREQQRLKQHIFRSAKRPQQPVTFGGTMCPTLLV